MTRSGGRLTAEEKAVTHFNRGMWKHDGRGDYGKAITDYGPAIKLKPDHLKALTNRGAAREIGDPTGARADFRKVLAIDPDHETVRNNLAELERAGSERKAFAVAQRF